MCRDELKKKGKGDLPIRRRGAPAAGALWKVRKESQKSPLSLEEKERRDGKSGHRNSSGL